MKIILNFCFYALLLIQLLPHSYAQEIDLDIQAYARVIHEPLDEISGIVKSKGREDLFWVHNDSGDQARIFAINSDGETVMPTYSKFTRYGGEPEEGKEPWQGFKILYAENHDWEDMTADENYIYIADIGNNLNTRNNLSIYAIGEIDPTASTQSAAIKQYQLQYSRKPDSGQNIGPADDDENYENFDAESIFYADNSLYIITKSRDFIFGEYFDEQTRLYRLDTYFTDQINTLTFIDENSNIESATGAEVSPDGQRLAVLSNSAIWIFSKPEQGDQWLSSDYKKINIDGKLSQDAEAIAWQDNNSIIFLNEQREMFSLKNL